MATFCKSLCPTSPIADIISNISLGNYRQIEWSRYGLAFRQHRNYLSQNLDSSFFRRVVLGYQTTPSTLFSYTYISVCQEESFSMARIILVVVQYLLLAGPNRISPIVLSRPLSRVRLSFQSFPLFFWLPLQVLFPLVSFATLSGI